MASGVALSNFHERLTRLTPAVPTADAQYQAGLLLLALAELPARIDHLSGLLALPREFVARCVRRLVDNGVLQNGALVSVWMEDEAQVEAFSADVKVALGSWWRRQDARGNLEWIEAGGWQKAFEYRMDGVEERNRTSYVAVESSRPLLNLEGLLSRSASVDAVWIGSAEPEARALPRSDDGFLGEPESGGRGTRGGWMDAEEEATADADWPAAMIACGSVDADRVVWLA